MSKIFLIILTINFFTLNLFANEPNFDSWLKNFKVEAIQSGISKKVVDEVMDEARFLPKVIEYDRYQPEFYEDTFTYIKKIIQKKFIKA